MKNILLIAGHGAGDPGATGNGYKEADLTRELVKLIQKRLAKFACVTFLPMERNWYQHICENGAYYDFRGFDYVLEVHFNAHKPDTVGNGKNKGTEIYVTMSEKSVTVEENILRRIVSLGFTNRGVKRKNYGLISYIKKQGTSAALLEVCFIDDIDDIKLYQAKKAEYADAVALGIAEGFGLSEEADELTKADVIAIIKEYEAEKAKESAGEWSRGAFAKAHKRGILDGTSPRGNVTREMLAVVLDRLGLL